jgi:hypothetical protein
MLANLFDELGGRGLGALLGLVVGGLIGWALAYWRRRRQRLSILEGDARDTLVIHQHLIERPPTTDPGGASPPPILRIRALGQGELAQVIPNDHLAAILLRRAHQVTTRDTLISMEGAEGSFLLETLTAFVCDRAANAPFERDLYVLAPCCEPAGLAEYQPITLLLIAVADLPLFESWPMCRDLRVEHGGDGARVLTLMAMARRFRSEQETLAKLRASGQRTRHVETMYVLDLALDKRAAPLPTKAIPWGRFESVLEQLKLE